MLVPQKVGLRSESYIYQRISSPSFLLSEAPFPHLSPSQTPLQGAQFFAGQGPCQSVQRPVGRQVPCDSDQPRHFPIHKMRCNLQEEQTHSWCFFFIIHKSLAGCCVGNLLSVNICEQSLISHKFAYTCETASWHFHFDWQNWLNKSKYAE